MLHLVLFGKWHVILIFCNGFLVQIISSVQECNTAATALGLPHVSIHHDGGRLPGCFLYTRLNAVEFNYNLQDTTDWKDTDSICYCPGTVEKHSDENSM